MSIVTYENVDTPIFDIYYPRYLFASGEDGSLLPDLSASVDSLFQDSAGTIPVTTYGDYVGLAVDQSGNGLDWVQATNAARPRYGRMPRSGARNTVANSTLLGSEYSGGFAEAEPDGEGPRGSAVQISRTATGTAFWMFTQPAQGAWEEGETYIATIAIKNVDAEQTRFRATGIAYEIRVDWSDPAASGLIPVDGWPDWYLMGQTFIASDPQEVGNRRMYIYPEFPTASSSGSIIVSGLQVEAGEEATPYQLATNLYDITEEGIPDQPILYADLADDAMDIELPAITGGTIVLAGDKGIWIDEFDFAGGTFSYGPTTYTGGPDGLMQDIVGERLIGGFVIDRALTATERAENIDYYTARGAGQEITP